MFKPLIYETGMVSITVLPVKGCIWGILRHVDVRYHSYQLATERRVGPSHNLCAKPPSLISVVYLNFNEQAEIPRQKQTLAQTRALALVTQTEELAPVATKPGYSRRYVSTYLHKTPYLF